MVSSASVRRVSLTATIVLLRKARLMGAVRLVVSATAKLCAVGCAGSQRIGSRMISGAGLSEVTAIHASGRSHAAASAARLRTARMAPIENRAGARRRPAFSNSRTAIG